MTLSDYYIGETEVTQALWQAVMGTNPSNFAGDTNRPVEGVSWTQARLSHRPPFTSLGLPSYCRSPLTLRGHGG